MTINERNEAKALADLAMKAELAASANRPKDIEFWTYRPEAIAEHIRNNNPQADALVTTRATSAAVDEIRPYIDELVVIRAAVFSLLFFGRSLKPFRTANTAAVVRFRAESFFKMRRI